MTETRLMTSNKTRIDTLDTDVLILGAGINGAGLFRELALQGVKVTLIDNRDFGSGTSAAPSRLIHGGVKYIETAELGLVAQSTLERNLLLKNAPHQVKPLKTTIPAFSWAQGIGAALRTLLGSKRAPRSRGALLIKVGLMIYDFFGARERVMPKHSMLSKKTALQCFPHLTDRIVGVGVYYDAKVNYPERLVWELIRDAIGSSDRAIALNYTEITDRQADSIQFRQEDGTELVVRPKRVINAGGPWIDRVNAQLGETTAFIGGTKGTHLILNHPDLAAQLKDQMIYFEADDGRICLIFEYLNRLLVGSTDIPAADPDEVSASTDEVAYLLQSIQELLPSANIQARQIEFVYSGIRPLPNTQTDDPGLISRDHSTPTLESTEQRRYPIISLVGGKWTTFRGFAEEVTDNLLQQLKQTRRCTTRNLPIGGGAGYPAETELPIWLRNHLPNSDYSQNRLLTLLERYGTLASDIARAEAENSARALNTLPDFTNVELAWLAKHEQIKHLDDLVLRRTALALSRAIFAESVGEIAQCCGEALKWSEARTDAEVQRTLTLLRDKHLMKL